MSAKKTFNRARLAACRSLDEMVFQKFCNEWKVPQPRTWLPMARLILMHKIRVNPDIRGFTAKEISVSRRWLAEHGFDEDVSNHGKPCPECGSRTGKPTFSGCMTCGMLQ